MIGTFFVCILSQGSFLSTPVRPHLPQRAVRGTLVLIGVPKNDSYEKKRVPIRSGSEPYFFLRL